MQIDDDSKTSASLLTTFIRNQIRIQSFAKKITKFALKSFRKTQKLHIEIETLFIIAKSDQFSQSITNVSEQQTIDEFSQIVIRRHQSNNEINKQKIGHDARFFTMKSEQMIIVQSRASVIATHSYQQFSSIRNNDDIIASTKCEQIHHEQIIRHIMKIIDSSLIRYFHKNDQQNHRSKKSKFSQSSSSSQI